MGRIDTYPQNAVLQPNSPVALAYAELGASIVGISAETEVARVTVAIPEGRRIRISAHSEIAVTNADVWVAGDIRLAVVGGTGVGQATLSGLAANQQDTLAIDTILTPSAGVYTYLFTVRRVAGTGTITAISAVNTRAFILVEDITGMPIPAATASVPVGVIAQAQSTTSVNTISTVVTLLTVNISVASGRTLKVTAGANLIINAAATRVIGNINLDGTSVGRWADRTMPSTSGYSSASDSVLISPSAGAHTITMDLTALSNTVSAEAGATEPIHLFVEDVTATPAAGNGAPASTLAYAEVTTSQGSITTTVDLTGLTVTVTVPAGRRLKVTGKTLFKSTVANDRVDMYLYQDGSIVQLSSVQLPIANAENSVDIEGIFSPSAGTHTYKLGAARSTGTGTITMSTLSTFPSFILVEDVTGATYTYSQPGVLPVSSTALPANPTIGAMVYEIDTGATKIWNGTSWQVFGQGASTNLGYAQVTANQGSITAEVDITGLAVTVTVPAGRRIQIFGQVSFTNTGTNQNVGSIKEGSTYLAQSALISGAAGTAETISWSAVTSPSAGTHTYKLTFQAIAGTASTSVNANNPAFILVEDITGTNSPAPAANVPVGVIAQAAYGLSVTGFSTEVDVPSSTLNVSVPAGRVLKITGEGRFDAITSTGHIIGRIYEDGVEIARFNNSDVVAGATLQAGNSILRSPAAGSHTYKLTVQKFNGGNTANYSMGTIFIEDVTPTPAATIGSPSSTLAYVEATANQTGITTEVDLTSLSVTVNVPAGRRIRIAGSVYLSSSVSDDAFGMRIKEGATILKESGTQGLANVGMSLEDSVIVSPSAGTHTYKLAALRFSGTGSVTSNAAATNPAYILIEDITSGTYTYSQPGVLSVNSTALPANPTIGAMVYEIDTGATKIWNGTSWQVFGQGASTTLGYAEVTANQSGITTETDLTGLTVTVTVPAGRRLEITGSIYIGRTVADGVTAMRIKEGSTQLHQADTFIRAAGEVVFLERSCVITPTAGTHTYKLTLALVTGTGTTNLTAGVGYPGFILVKDITGTNAPAPIVNVPVGILAQAPLTATQTGITTVVDLVGMSANINVPTGRTLRLTASCAVGGTVSTDIVRASIKEGAANLQIRDTPLNVASGTSGNVNLEFSVLVSPTAGQHTYKVTLERMVGTGTVQASTNATWPSFLLIEDITPTPTTGTGTPSSTLAYAENFANGQTFTNTYVDLPGSSLTVTVTAGRRIRISGKAHLSTGISNDRVILAIREGSTVLNDTYMIQPVSGVGQDMFVSAVTSPSTGSHTYVLSAIRQSGTGTGTVYSVAGDSGTYILIEDITGVGVSGHTHTELDDTGWISLVPLLINSWVSYDNVYGPPRYRKKAGIVYLQGLIRSGTLGAPVATLPVGFRPTLKLLFTTMGDNNVINRYDLQADGLLINAAGASNTWSALNGITFPAEQ